MRPALFLTVIVIIYLSVCVPAVATVEKQGESSDEQKSWSWSPYCGLYCLYATMKQQGGQIEFSSLVKPEYCGSPQGSTSAELLRAAEDMGFHALAVKNMSPRFLRELNCAAILHVKRNVDARKYNHYVLFMGVADNKARIFDPPNSITLVPFHELAPRWDGLGLIISAQPIDPGTIFVPARKRFILYVVIAVAVILTVHWGRRRFSAAVMINRRRLVGLSAAQSIGLTIAALFCGMIYHFANNEGFLAHANATNSVQQAHIANFVPKVNSKQVAKLLNSDTVIIDARFARDFDTGHIEGAINVPVDICDKGVSAAMNAIDKNAPIVVYCQSAGCSFALKITKRLKDNGFSNISIFKGGWNEWKAKENK